MQSDLSPPVVRALQKELDELRRKRAELIGPLDEEIGQIEAHLTNGKTIEPLQKRPTTVTMFTNSFRPVEDAGARQLNLAAVLLCKDALSGGKKLSVEELHALVVGGGVHLKAEDPCRRLGQLLSQRRDWFQTDRKNGWSLKGETPVGVHSNGVSSATSAEDLV